ncbi:MAG: hypothetical protein K2P14_02015 [Anaeroplasmataceae bacterium]|nr:hypothetical protein [Anaeroplasmataceae bacterium]
MLDGIKCRITKLSFNNGDWCKVSESTQNWNSIPISNMLQAKKFYKNNMKVITKQTRRFGRVVSSVTVRDMFMDSKKIYEFDYSNAQRKVII